MACTGGNSLPKTDWSSVGKEKVGDKGGGVGVSTSPPITSAKAERKPFIPETAIFSSRNHPRRPGMWS